MSFRCRRISPVAALAASLVFTTGFGFGTKAEAAAEPAAASTPPDSTSMNVAVGKAEDLKDFDTLVIPTVYIGLPVEGKTAVSKQGSALRTLGGGSANSVKASASFKVLGLDKALAQQIAQRIQDDLIAQLRATGFTVLTYDDIKEQDYVKDALRFDLTKEGPGLVLQPPGSPDLMWVTPTDDQAFKVGMNGGVYNQFIRLGKPKFKDVVMIIPHLTFTSPQLVGSTGASYSQISAGVDAFPSMQLTSAMAPWMSATPHVRMGGGNVPGVMLKGPVTVADNVGTLAKEDKTPTAANALSKGLSLLGGGGSISASSASYTMTIDPVVYADTAVKGARQFNAEIAKVAASVR